MAPDIDGKIYVTEFAGLTDASELPPPGTLATIEITATKEYDLFGRVTEILRPPARGEISPVSVNPFPILA